MKRKFFIMMLFLLCISINGCTDKTKIANNYFNDGKYGKALEYYEKINSNDIKVLTSKLKCYIEINDINNALQTIDKIESSDGYNESINEKYSVEYNKIQLLYKSQKYDSAIKYAEKFEKSNSLDLLKKQVEMILIDSYIRVGKDEEGIKKINKILSQGQERDNEQKQYLYRSLYSCLYNDEQYEEALKISDILITLDTNNVDYYISKAMAISKVKDFTEAYLYLENINTKIKDSKIEQFILGFKEQSPN